jgi:hypothetical protein
LGSELKPLLWFVHQLDLRGNMSYLKEAADFADFSRAFFASLRLCVSFSQ